MATTVNIINGAGGSLNELKGYTINRVAKVEGLSGLNSAAAILAALNASGLPTMRSEYPGKENMLLVDKSCTLTGPNTADVTLSYKTGTYGSQQSDGRSKAILTVGSTASQRTFDTDYDGEKVTVSYPPEKDQGVDMQVYDPTLTITLQQRETDNPMLKSIIYVGKTNSTVWSIIPTDSAANKWLCVELSGQSDDGGESYWVTYSFVYNAYTWAARVKWIDPTTGRAPSDLQAGVGRKTIDVYGEADFNALGLVV